jgi:hypothetical protein
MHSTARDAGELETTIDYLDFAYRFCDNAITLAAQWFAP